LSGNLIVPNGQGLCYFYWADALILLGMAGLNGLRSLSYYFYIIKVVHLSRQKIRYFLMNFMLLHNQLTRLDNTSQPAYDGGWKNGCI
jgi:hypothetical protein